MGLETGVLVVGGTGLVGSGVAFRRGLIPRNPVIGYRMRSTLASAESWDAGHRAAAGPTMLLGLLWVVLGLADRERDMAEARAVGVVVASLALVGWAALRAVRAADAAALGTDLSPNGHSSKG